MHQHVRNKISNSSNALVKILVVYIGSFGFRILAISRKFTQICNYVFVYCSSDYTVRWLWSFGIIWVGLNFKSDSSGHAGLVQFQLRP
jgi:hypothetical protein